MPDEANKNKAYWESYQPGSTYDGYEKMRALYPDMNGARKGGENRAQTARRVHGKFAPDDPNKPFKVDMDSHYRGGVEGGRKRKAQVDVLGLRDLQTGRFIKLEDE